MKVNRTTVLLEESDCNKIKRVAKKYFSKIYSFHFNEKPIVATFKIKEKEKNKIDDFYGEIHLDNNFNSKLYIDIKF
jgi:hypothetical protein